MNMNKSQRPQNNLPSIYCGNLPKEAFYDLDLYKVFQLNKHPIVKAKVVIDKKTGKSLGYGYICFYKMEDAERCLKEMNNHLVRDKSIRLSMKYENKAFDEKANILIKNIDKTVTQSQLFELFQNFGKIISCKLESYNDGTSRGFAYVQYETEQ